MTTKTKKESDIIAFRIPKYKADLFRQKCTDKNRKYSDVLRELIDIILIAA